MRLNNYIEESILLESIFEGIFSKILNKIANKPTKVVEKLFKDSWNKLANELKTNRLEKDALNIINRHFRTQYKSLDQVSKLKISEMPSSTLEESFKHWWEKIKGEAFPSLAFYPMLQVFFEIDKIIKGMDYNGRIILVYGIMWVFLISGKYVTEWNIWRKLNPKEYEEEGSKKIPFF